VLSLQTPERNCGQATAKNVDIASRLGEWGDH
jgi:hypothetical protein